MHSKYKKDLGNKGENVALQFLLQNHLRLCDHNFQIWGGQIDLIMFDSNSYSGDGEYVFVEVKTRKMGEVDFGQIISKRQQITLVKTAQRWFEDKGLVDVDWRFDLIVIDARQDKGEQVEWIKNIIA